MIIHHLFEKVQEMSRALWESGNLRSPVHLCGGNEVQLMNLFMVMGKDDWIFSTHRSHYHFVIACKLRGLTDDETMARLESHIRNGNSIAIQDPEVKFRSSAILAGCCPIAVGLGMAWKRDKHNAMDRIWVFIGDGASDNGNFFEAAQYAFSQKLNIKFVIENNNYSVGTLYEDRWGTVDRPEYPKNVEQYRYYRTVPHVGTGKHITF